MGFLDFERECAVEDSGTIGNTGFLIVIADKGGQ
jgi:hypothetical protein